MNQITTKEELAKAPSYSILSVLLSLIRASQPDDGREAASVGYPIELSRDGVVMHGNHRFHRARQAGKSSIAATIFTPGSDNIQPPPQTLV